jgi:hypothetical protein
VGHVVEVVLAESYPFKMLNLRGLKVHEQAEGNIRRTGRVSASRLAGSLSTPPKAFSSPSLDRQSASQRVE